MDGAFALKKIEELKPDVVTLDLEMPRMDGMETLRLIMRRTPLPVILFSTHSKEGGYATFKALAMGAVDFLAKPKDASSHLDEIADQLIAKIKVAKRAVGRSFRRRHRRNSRAEKSNPYCAASAPLYRHRNFNRRPKRAAICLSQIPRISIRDRDCAAHAGRFHRNVREAPRRMLRS